MIDRVRLAPVIAVAAVLAASCAPPAGPAPAPAAAPTSVDVGAAKRRIVAELDDWHQAAAKADEARYFDHFAPDGLFLGTDARERWSVADFRAYAHPHFAKGKAWAFTSVRREVTVDPTGRIAWFDEDLATPNLGAARGSGVLVERGGRWLISQYNLAVTVPNDRFDVVKAAIDGEGPCRSGTGALHVVVSFFGPQPPSPPPPKERDPYCRAKPFQPDEVRITSGRLRDAVVRLAPGAVRGNFKEPAAAIEVVVKDCAFVPRVAAALTGQRFVFANSDPAPHALRASFNGNSWFDTKLAEHATFPSQLRAHEAGVVAYQSSTQPTMKGFALVTDHPYFALTDDKGEVRLERVPAGHYGVEAWHPSFGFKRSTVDVVDDKTIEVGFGYSAADKDKAAL